MTEPTAARKVDPEDGQPTVEERLAATEERLAAAETQLQELAGLFTTFAAKTAAALDRRVVTSSLPPELQVRPGRASATPRSRIVRGEPRERLDGAKQQPIP